MNVHVQGFFLLNFHSPNDSTNICFRLCVDLWHFVLTFYTLSSGNESCMYGWNTFNPRDSSFLVNLFSYSVFLFIYLFIFILWTIMLGTCCNSCLWGNRLPLFPLFCYGWCSLICFGICSVNVLRFLYWTRRTERAKDGTILLLRSLSYTLCQTTSHEALFHFFGSAFPFCGSHSSSSGNCWSGCWQASPSWLCWCCSPSQKTQLEFFYPSMYLMGGHQLHWWWQPCACPPAPWHRTYWIHPSYHSWEARCPRDSQPSIQSPHWEASLWHPLPSFPPVSLPST